MAQATGQHDSKATVTLDRLNSHGLELDMPMDEGIARAVHILREAGIETFESCEGGEGHPFFEPTIRFSGNPGEGFRAYAVAVTHGLPVKDIRRAWGVSDGELSGPWWEIVFRTKVRSSDA